MGSSHVPKSGLLTRLPHFNKVRTTREVDMPKSSFVLYLDYKKHFDLIQDDTDFRRLIEAIFAYCETGTEPSDLSPVALMAFSFIRANLDRDNEKYEAVKEKRKEAGRLGGLAKASNAKQMVAKASNAKQSVANVADTVTGTDTGTVECNTITPHTPQEGDSVGRRSTRFTPPSPDEVQRYCDERHNGIVGSEFCDFYASKGWMIGKAKMRDWKAAIRTWERKRQEIREAAQDKFAGAI